MQYFIDAMAVMSCFSPFLDFELQFTALRKRSQTADARSQTADARSQTADERSQAADACSQTADKRS